MFIRKERFGWLTYDPADQKPIVIGAEELPEEVRRFCTTIINPQGYGAFLSAPTSLYVYPSMNCNKGCPHCYFSAMINRDRIIMDNRTVDRVIGQVRDSGVFMVNILGGEPLMSGTWDAVRRLTDALLAMDVMVNLTTNGIELLEFIDHLRRLKSRFKDLFRLNLSFNAGDENQTYSEKLRVALQEISLNGPEIDMNTVVLEHDFDRYRAVIGHLMKNPWIKRLNLLYPRTKQKPLISEHLSFCQSFVEVLGQERVNIELPFSHVYTNAAADDSVFAHFHYGCGIGKRTLSVSPDGSVFACSKQIDRGQFLLGDIFEKMTILWDRSYRIRAASDLKLIAGQCQGKCRYFDICESCIADRNEGMDLFCEHVKT